jgi:hypothetical protein
MSFCYSRRLNSVMAACILDDVMTIQCMCWRMAVPKEHLPGLAGCSTSEICYAVCCSRLEAGPYVSRKLTLALGAQQASPL